MSTSDRVPASSGQAGFTFLWVLMTVALLGFGLTAALSVQSTAVQREKERELLSIGRQFRTAIARYYESQSAGRGREYPQSLEDLLKDNRVPGIQRHLRKVFVDPMTGKAEWGFVLIAGRIAGIHSLSGSVPFQQAGFEPEDMSFAGKKKLSEWVFTYPSDLLLRPAASGPAFVQPMVNPGGKQ